LKKSYQRDIILKVVIDSFDHPTAEVVYNKVKQIIPNISLGTVYRNLNVLTDNGYVKRIGISNNQDRFDKTTANHHHIRCIMCNDVKDIFYDTASEFYDKIELETKYKIISKDLVFEGICPNCIEKGK
jgi:Fur family peroxide stress response transcriptional regulator